MAKHIVTRRTLLAGGITVAATAALGAAPAAAAPLTNAQLTAKLVAYQRSRGGTFAVALYDRRNAKTFSYLPTWRNETLSIIKVLIMATVLRRCEERRVNLTATQLAEAAAMITRSDNTATNALLTWAGVANVRRVAGLYGLKSTVVQGGTVAGASNWWGYSTTTALDYLGLMNGLVWGSPVLRPANSAFLLSFMRRIISTQRWGVSVPPLPVGLGWETKNGWGPRSGGYRLNSVGHIWGNGRNYSAVILSRAPAGFFYGRDTVNGVSKIVYGALAQPLA